MTTAKEQSASAKQAQQEQVNAVGFLSWRTSRDLSVLNALCVCLLLWLFVSDRVWLNISRRVAKVAQLPLRCTWLCITGI